MAQWNHDLLARLVAPGIADFTKARVPDVMQEFPELRHWIPNHFLNTVFGTRFKGNSRIFIFNVIYRAQICLVDYDEGRTRTQDFLSASVPSNPSTSRYFRALARWEASLLNYSIAIDLLKTLLDQKVFQKSDGSQIQRAYDLANSVKHHATHVTAAGPLADAPDLIPAPNGEPEVIPLWLSNSGLHSGSLELSFIEYGACVRDLAETAQKFTNPAAFIQELREYQMASAVEDPVATSDACVSD